MNITNTMNKYLPSMNELSMTGMQLVDFKRKVKPYLKNPSMSFSSANVPDSDMDSLIKLKLFKMKKVPAKSPDVDGKFDYQYTLTPTGKQVLKTLQKQGKL